MELPPLRPSSSSTRIGGLVQLQSIMHPRTSAVQSEATLHHMIQLPPIQNYVDNYVDNRGARSAHEDMVRRGSVLTDHTSDNASIYQMSRSSSPNATFGDAGPSTAAPARATRRKRTDRKNFWKRGQDGVQTGKVTKDEGEGGRRYGHAILLAMLQQELLAINEDLPKEAKQGFGTVKPGWTLLKSNNRSEDVSAEGLLPLQWNKTNIYDSSCQTMRDSTDLEHNIVKHRFREEAEAQRLLHGGAKLSDDVKSFLSTIAYGGLSGRIGTASRLRGSVHFSCQL
ncbi:hypothetical protein ACN47E_004701 [Coniothyrium glycines]